MKQILTTLILLASMLIQAPKASELDQELAPPLVIQNHIEDVLKVVDQQYVYPATAKLMRSFVNNEVTLGNYRDIKSPRALVEKLQSDLREASRDTHMSLHLAEDRSDRKTQVLSPSKLDQEFEVGVVSSISNTNTIGYLRFNKFGGDKQTRERIAGAMKELQTTDSLIIDLRKNGGGDPDLVVFLSSYFLHENTHLWSIVGRDGTSLTEAKSIAQNINYDGELCILISNYTGSAAEAFAYTLSNLSRASTIGQTTGGAAHLVEMARANDVIDVRISTARVYSEITKSNWEGGGVIPDIEVETSQAKSAAVNYLSNKNR